MWFYQTQAEPADSSAPERIRALPLTAEPERMGRSDPGSRGQIVNCSTLLKAVETDVAQLLAQLADVRQRHESWLLKSATAINQAGCIVGYGTKNGAARGFLLTPKP